ncbi:MAG: S1 RNA-binding domain-containing protein, partial [Sphingomonadales bacterium]|nr:S1 RNA-binding domain-containing protein [Sphingomonadales bacterium]
VDIGVHQDGLVHISQLADSFVKDPRDVVKPGDVVMVRVQEVDANRKRISLTMKSGAPDAVREAAPKKVAPQRKAKPTQSADASGNALAEAFAKARAKGN